MRKQTRLRKPGSSLLKALGKAGNYITEVPSVLAIGEVRDKKIAVFLASSSGKPEDTLDLFPTKWVPEKYLPRMKVAIRALEDRYDPMGAGDKPSLTVVTGQPRRWNINPRLAGALGAVIRDKQGRLFILGTNHVLSVNGRVPDSDLVLTWNSASVTIGRTMPGQFVPLTHESNNTVDCAVAQLSDEGIRRFHFDVPVAQNGVVPPLDPDRNGKGIPNTPIVISDWKQIVKPDEITPGDRVMKYGVGLQRKTETIQAVKAEFFGDYSFGRFRFAEQIFIGPPKSKKASQPRDRFAEDGDSGAIVLNQTRNKVVGMVFNSAGSAFAVACPMSEVMHELAYKGIEIAGDMPPRRKRP